MGSPGADELALGQSCQSSSSLHLSPPWPWPPLSLMRPRYPAPTPRLQLTPGTAITAMEDTEATMVDMLGLMAPTATTARDLPMSPHLPSLDPTPRPTLTRGIPTMDIMAMELTDLMVMATTPTGPMVTGDKQWRPSRTTSDLSLPTHL